ncbi:hypothetical protein Cgig2_009764 [Carnegiea gigantea]|uniref:acetyl-CoA C-acyltransferase n=1 Tax=Carnegiea gigantea TaxID=171969 RepID=A0A9Q1JV22_9CARY|nr:hypothetical protein Cgig2_009764 [Carnegiea gigantea]
MEKAINRQRVLLDHLRPSSSSDHSYEASLSASNCMAGGSSAYHRTTAFGDDVVIVAAHRTPLCKAKRGAFKDTYPDDLLAPVLKRIISAKFCLTGIGAGLESMTTNPMAWEGSVNPRVKELAQAQDCLLPMGVTSENVAHRFGVTREEQDQAALVDPKTGDEKPITVTVDDGIRPNANVSELAKLKPVFKKNGTTTAGNSSQVTDGAGGVLLMRRSTAMHKGLPILGVFRTFAAVGVDPAIMGIGPAVAIPAAVKAAGLELDDIDLFEINEAFASQFVYCRKKLDLNPEKINVNGGAMAIGHPLGATGARCVATLLHEMKRRGKDCRFGVVSMCIGTGMGAAAVFERGDAADELSNARKAEAHGFLSKDAK